MVIQPKTFPQWLANYIDKPEPRGQLARDWSLLQTSSEFHYGFSNDELLSFLDRGLWDDELERLACCGLWNEGRDYNTDATYYAARRAYAVYALRHAQRYGRGSR